MSIALLDVNVLIALLWPGHVHHERASLWYRNEHARGWATCVLTEAGFVRISTQTAGGFVLQEALDVLDHMCGSPQHHFWPLDGSVRGLEPEIRQRIHGHQQLADAILLDLAIRRGGKLVTLDARVRNLLAPDSPHAGAIEVIPETSERRSIP